MPEQLTIDGRGEKVPAAESFQNGNSETVPLFDAPTTMRGQLSAWAETVCDPAPIEADPLAEWTLKVTDGAA